MAFWKIESRTDRNERETRAEKTKMQNKHRIRFQQK